MRTRETRILTRCLINVWIYVALRIRYHAEGGNDLSKRLEMHLTTCNNYNWAFSDPHVAEGVLDSIVESRICFLFLSHLSALFLSSRSLPQIYFYRCEKHVCKCGTCVRTRAWGECVEWSFLRNFASTFPSWKVLLVGQKQRPPSQQSSSYDLHDRLIHVATLTNVVRPTLSRQLPPRTLSFPLFLPPPWLSRPPSIVTRIALPTN